MALLSSIHSMKYIAIRNGQLKTLVNKLSSQGRTGLPILHCRKYSHCSSQSGVQSTFTHHRRKFDVIPSHYLNANAGSSITFVPHKTLTRESTLTHIDKERGEAGSRKRRRQLIELPQDSHLSTDQWRQMKMEWLEEQKQRRKHYIERTPFEYELRAMESIASQMLSDAAKSFVTFIKDEHPVLKYELMSKCLFMCITCQDLEGLLWCVDWLEGNHDMMDKGTIANAVSGLCITDRWRESVRFIAKANETDCVTSRILEPYLIAACKYGDKSLAKSVLEDHYKRDLIPSDASVLKIITTFKSKADDLSLIEESEQVVTRLLDYQRVKRIFPSQSIAKELGNWFKSKQHETWRVSKTRISHKGVCESCSRHLEPLQMTEDEFNLLREEIFSKVIRGKDIFKKTTPKELDAFMHFIDSGPMYDIVLDGLNVAKIKKKKSPGKVLRQFVEYLTKSCGYTCLVLGRHHMLKQRSQFEKGDMDVIQKLADCFFTQNMSEDDPFMLYATMHSGTKTKYITRDLMRDHKALLSPGAHLSFIKWQRTQQLTPVDFREGKAIFEQNLAHDTVIQSTDRSWHIPYDDGQPRFSYELPLTWMCAVRD